MTWYDMHRCVYDYIRASETGAPESFDIGRYELTEQERRAFEQRDVAALYQLDLHGVLLNRFCREIGFSRDQYRVILRPFAVPAERAGRWRS